MEFAKIQFLPVCSNCKQIIYDTIDYRVETDREVATIHDSKITQIMAMPVKLIFPYQCKNCGAVFENITMPTKLPFYGEDYRGVDNERRRKSNT